MIPDPILFSWGVFTIRWYGVLMVSGMAIAVLLSCLEAKRQGLSGDHYFNMCLMVLIFGIIGARAYYVLFNWDYYGENLIKVFAINEGGLAIHGGLIVGSLVFVLMGMYYRIGGWRSIDIAAPYTALAQAIGRWGNYFNQEAYGYAVDKGKIPWAMFIDGAYRHPTFLYESIWDLLVFLFLLWLRRRKTVMTGDVFCVYAIVYSAGRIVIEAFRTDSLMLGSFRIAQVVSAAAILLFSLAIVLRHKGKDQGGKIISVR
ncbi:MAG: prolipoprotein diacylglyceryl transferase [Clostridiales bacterium]|nr:prolipoprotein diacylglyceryl transferase [Clostridiales bacterium]